MPSIQDRINAFEKNAAMAALPPRNGVLHTSDPPSILEEPISPVFNSFSPIIPFTSPRSISSGSPSPSPPNLGRKSSLIDLKDWVVDDGPPTQRPRQNVKLTNGKTNGGIAEGWNSRTSSSSSAPLINLESPPKIKAVKAPPLPPRKPSFNSLKAASNNNALRPPVRSDSLSVEQNNYSPLHTLTADPLRKGSGPGHVPASSISSFHSVSLSSDGGTADNDSPGSVSNFIATFPMDRQNSGDADSLNESYENVSTSAISPTTASTLVFDWGEAMNKAKQSCPPKLPQRPTVMPSTARTPTPRSVPTSPKLTARTNSSSSSVSTTTTTRRVPPPPPSFHPPPTIRFAPRSSRTSLASTSASDRASDRSSIMSTATTTSRTSISTRASMQTTNKLSRPTPVPAAARKRYESVFIGNIVQWRKAEKVAAKKKSALLSPSGTKKSRQAAGWRGLSVDLITNPEDHPVLSGKVNEDEEDENEKSEIGPNERLDGFSIKRLWNASKLEKEKLRAIWNECDPTGQGSLDRDAFVKGMWRIDEELRRAQITRQTSRIRSVPPLKPSTPRLILR